ncbi:hypothetical protein B4U79_16998, partial [Dinothrombium tinctorium]
EAIPMIDSNKIVKRIDFLRGKVANDDLEAGTYGEPIDEREIDAMAIGWNSRYAKNVSSCVYDVSSFIQTDHTWIIHLRKKIAIAFITIELKDQLAASLLNYDNPFVNAFVNRFRTCKLHYVDNTVGSLVQILCEVNSTAYAELEKRNGLLDKLSLHFNEQISKTKFNVISLCLYTFPNSCGMPEIPLNTIVTNSSSKVQFKCISNDYHYENGDDVQEIECLPDSKWSKEVKPCKPKVVCPLKTDQTYRIRNKLMNNETTEEYIYQNSVFVNGSLFAIPSTVEIHRCHDRVVGQRICDDKGKWSGNDTNCEGVPRTAKVKSRKLEGYNERSIQTIVILSVVVVIASLVVILLLTYIICSKCRDE